MESQETKTDVYRKVTDQIVASLEAGTRPWMQPWNSPQIAARLPMRGTGEPYRGINVVLLWAQACAKGYMQGTWMTHKQASELKAHVRKGEKGTTVVYADRATVKDWDEDGRHIERSYAFLKAYTVFNVEQIEGLPTRFFADAPADASGSEPHAEAESFFAATGAEFRHGGCRAFYSTREDFIQLPPVDAFHDGHSYTATKAHELVHWTGHEQRLAREFGKRFGDDAYAFEELVAELGAAFLCAQLGVEPEVREDHAAYLASWLRVLKADKRSVIAAAAHAQRAVDFLQAATAR